LYYASNFYNIRVDKPLFDGEERISIYNYINTGDEINIFYGNADDLINFIKN
jgi:hypothetical protein